MTIPALLAVLLLAPAAPHPPKPTPAAPAPVYGTVSICAATGSRPVPGPVAFTLGAPGSAGGTQTVSVAIGKCATPIFYPAGTALTILEAVPAGAAVTAIAASGAGTLTTVSAVAGSATFTVGNAPATITFTTNGPAPSPVPARCKVPNLKGLLLATAKAQVRSRGCTVGAIERKPSAVFVAGRVSGQSPGAGAVVAHGAPVVIVVSRGRT